MTDFERKVIEAAQEHLCYQEYGPAESGVFEFAHASRAVVGEGCARVCEAEAFPIIEDDSCEHYNIATKHCAAASRELTKGK